MRIALSLGSGGARGYAHIGIIDELKARGHTVVAIAGTSMGALVGGLAAAGRLEEYAEWVTGMSQRDVLRLLDPAFNVPGIIRGQRVIDRVADILEGARIEQCRVPFTAVATDLTTQREVWFQHGPMATAIRASIAIPSAFTPVMINGRLLADGGLVNPVPMEPLLGTPADLTIAVDVSARGRHGGTHQPVSESSDEEDADWRERFRRNTAGLLDSEAVRSLLALLGRHRGADGDGESAREEAEAQAASAQASGGPVDDLTLQELPRDLRLTDVLSLSYGVSAAMLGRFRIAANPPDVLLTVPIEAAGVFDFHRATELIDLGRSTAVDALDAAGL